MLIYKGEYSIVEKSFHWTINILFLVEQELIFYTVYCELWKNQTKTISANYLQRKKEEHTETLLKIMHDIPLHRFIENKISLLVQYNAYVIDSVRYHSFFDMFLAWLESPLAVVMSIPAAPCYQPR